MLKISASQIATWRACPTKWGFQYLDGIRPPEGAAAALGTKIHGQLESYFLGQEQPQDERALALLQHLPQPHPDLRVEHPWALILPAGNTTVLARGYMDLLWLSSATVAVLDHKTTSNLRWAKSETDLLTDPQAILYGLAARHESKTRYGHFPEFVDLQWTYAQTRGYRPPLPPTKPVRIRQSLTVLEDGLTGVCADAAQMVAANEQGAKAKDLVGSRDACEAFGGCPFRQQCPHYGVLTAFHKAQYEEKPTMNSELLARLARLAGENIAPPTEAPAPAPVAAETPAPAPVAAEPSREPEMAPFDTSGLDEPLPENASGVLPPDARANVSPLDPPLPPAKEKRGPGRPRKSSATATATVETPIMPIDTESNDTIAYVTMPKPEPVVTATPAPAPAAEPAAEAAPAAEPEPTPEPAPEPEDKLAATLAHLDNDDVCVMMLLSLSNAFQKRGFYRLGGDVLHILDSFEQLRSVK